MEYAQKNQERSPENILVIRHGAFGDLVQAMGPLAAIRRHHQGEKITFLTTAPYKTMMESCPYVDQVWIDARPKFWDLPGLLALRRRLRDEKFSRVYDLQNSDRSCLYFWLLSPHRPQWVGTALGASHRNTSPTRTKGRAFDGHVETLALAGIHDIAPDPLEWLVGDPHILETTRPYVLMVPGSSAQHVIKRFPMHSYRDLAESLGRAGYDVLITGAPNEKDLGNAIAQGLPHIHNLCGATTMMDLPGLARGACGAVGNDTGPMHVFGVTGCPVLTLFDTRASNPTRHQPLGPASHAIAVTDLQTLKAETVYDVLLKILRPVPVLMVQMKESVPEEKSAASQ